MTATASNVLSCVKISEVYRALGGPEPQGVRGPAFWRDGDGLNVSMNDARGVWHDFTSDEGGGILDLVVKVRGGSRVDALRWAADLAGVPIDETPLSATDRARWAAERREVERTLPEARQWRRAAVSMAEELLGTLKAALTDRTLPQPEIGELGRLTALLQRLRRIDGAELVAEYGWWRENHPGMTAAMVWAVDAREGAERAAVTEYLQLSDSQRRAA